MKNLKIKLFAIKRLYDIIFFRLIPAFFLLKRAKG